MSDSHSQHEFSFEGSAQKDGLNQWRTQRERASLRLARRLGLPLGHEVEVLLKNGMMLRGKLQLKESLLFLDDLEAKDLELVIERANFRNTDIESCVRMDG